MWVGVWVWVWVWAWVSAWVGVAVGVGVGVGVGRVAGLSQRKRNTNRYACTHTCARARNTLASLEVAAVDFWALAALASVAWGGWMGVGVGVCLKGVGWVG